MKKFALNHPCPRPPLAPGQIVDPTSLKRGEDYPNEWAKRQAKLAKQAREAVRKCQGKDLRREERGQRKYCF